MTSTAWGHGYPCCSDRCGTAFAISKKRFQMDLERAKEYAARANSEVKRLENILAERWFPARSVANPGAGQ
jgi:hypothetical protein